MSGTEAKPALNVRIAPAFNFLAEALAEVRANYRILATVSAGYAALGTSSMISSELFVRSAGLPSKCLLLASLGLAVVAMGGAFIGEGKAAAIAMVLSNARMQSDMGHVEDSLQTAHKAQALFQGLKFAKSGSVIEALLAISLLSGLGALATYIL